MTPQNVIAACERAGISLNELMRRAGVGRAFMWRWQTGRIQPRQATLDRIADVLRGGGLI